MGDDDVPFTVVIGKQQGREPTTVITVHRDNTPNRQLSPQRKALASPGVSTPSASAKDSLTGTRDTATGDYSESPPEGQGLSENRIDQPGAQVNGPDWRTEKPEDYSPLPQEAGSGADAGETQAGVSAEKSVVAMEIAEGRRVHTEEEHAALQALAREEADMNTEQDAILSAVDMLDRSGADVTSETRASLQSRLVAAGGSQGQASRETEVFSRLASTVSRITGQAPNRLINEGFRFGAEGQGGVTYYQDAVKRQKFEAAPTAQVMGEEIYSPQETLPGKTAIRDKLIEWLSERGWFKKYTNTDTGWDNINVSRSSIRDILFHGSGRGKVQAIAALPQLIENGIHLESQDIENGLKRHVFAAKLDIGGEPFVVGFVVQEDQQGRKYYEHELTEMENLGSLASPAQRQEQTRAGRDSIMNVVQKHLGVNPDMTLFQSARPSPRGRTEFLSDDTINTNGGPAGTSGTGLSEFNPDTGE